MKYRIGYSIKPLRNDDGLVIFTDGTNEIMPSEKSCVDYGYKWDRANGVCVINNNTNVNVAAAISNGYNKILGRGNKTGGVVDNSIIAGEGNRFEGQNKNVFVNGNKNLVKSGVFNSAIVSGDNNCLANDVNNSTIISGVGAISIRDNETITGGFYTSGYADVSGTPQNFSTQTSTFNMQASIPAGSSGVSNLFTQNGDTYMNTHSNSFVSLTARCMVSGDSANATSCGTLVGQASVSSTGVVSSVHFEYINDTNQGLKGDNDFELILETNDVLAIKCTLNRTDQHSIATASVTISEIIHDPSITL